jgi:hypothetical protein
VKKIIALLFLVSFGAYADIDAVCTPSPPKNSVVIGYKGCTLVNGTPAETITLHVVKTTPDESRIFRIVLNFGTSGTGDAVMVEAGSVPPDTNCDPSQAVTTHGVTYYRVDVARSLITFSGNNKPPIVWAICPG